METGSWWLVVMPAGAQREPLATRKLDIHFALQHQADGQAGTVQRWPW